MTAPTLAPPPMLADLTFARSSGGKVYTHVSDWEGAQPLQVGDVIEVVDGEDVALPARVEAIDADGTVVARLRDAGGVGVAITGAIERLLSMPTEQHQDFSVEQLMEDFNAFSDLRSATAALSGPCSSSEAG